MGPKEAWVRFAVAFLTRGYVAEEAAKRADIMSLEYAQRFEDHTKTSRQEVQADATERREVRAEERRSDLPISGENRQEQAETAALEEAIEGYEGERKGKKR